MRTRFWLFKPETLKTLFVLLHAVQYSARPLIEVEVLNLKEPDKFLHLHISTSWQENCYNCALRNVVSLKHYQFRFSLRLKQMNWSRNPLLSFLQFIFNIPFLKWIPAKSISLSLSWHRISFKVGKSLGRVATLKLISVIELLHIQWLLYSVIRFELLLVFCMCILCRWISASLPSQVSRSDGVVTGIFAPLRHFLSEPSF